MGNLQKKKMAEIKKRITAPILKPNDDQKLETFLGAYEFTFIMTLIKQEKLVFILVILCKREY